MAKRFQKFTGKKWTNIVRKSWNDKTDWEAAIAAKMPIRIVHDSGSFKVIKFAENLPEGKEMGKRKQPKAVEAVAA
jgi:hypothetical protein